MARTPPFQQRFPVVGIGASAGGLPAILSLLKHLPTNTGMAFVVVQHLSPQSESILPSLLAHATTLPVLEATEGLELAPDHVYVTPPGVRLTLGQGALHLAVRQEPWQRLRLIDDFLNSLAEEAPGRAIGVLLSGTGADGTRGLKAIRAAGGTTLVQDPVSAEFSGMPQSAIAAGCADHVLFPEAIAGTLAQLASPVLSLAPHTVPSEPRPETVSEPGLRRVFQLLRDAFGVDFTHYKPTAIHRRLERRMALSKVDHLEDYARSLEEHPEELELLHEDLLIHVTRFFRDPATFEALQRTVFPELLQDRPPHLPLRIWVPGCATGEEVYSLLISLLEYLDTLRLKPRLQVFATDLSEAALEQARNGIYPPSIAAHLSADRLRRFFVKTDGRYRVQTFLRNLCIFGRQNLVSDPPFSHIDLISCRNVLIYLGPMLQKKVLPILHYALRPKGFLVLGASETVGSFAELFSLVDKRGRIYQKRNTEFPPTGLFPPSEPSLVRLLGLQRPPAPAVASMDPQRAADRVVLARYGPPGVIVNDELEILHFRGHTAPYLEPVPSAAGRNLLELARVGLRRELRAAIRQARRTARHVRKEGLPLSRGARPRRVNLEVHPLLHAPEGGPPSFLVLFEEVPACPPATARKGRRASSQRLLGAAEREIARLREELRSTREHLQTVMAQQEASSHALHMATEEAQSSKEQLQSTHEQLAASKEELLATNETLTTANERLHDRNLELSQLNSALNQLLDSAQIATVLLGRDRRIRHFTPRAAKVLGLSATDMGRSLLDVQVSIPLPAMEAALSAVTKRLTAIEQVVRDRNGHWYSLRLHPYPAPDGRLEGIVMALLDIERLKRHLDAIPKSEIKKSQ